MRRHLSPLIWAPVMLGLVAPIARAEDRSGNAREATLMLRNFETYCKDSTASAPSQSGGKYVVYAYSVLRQRMEREMGDRPQVTPLVWATVFDSPERLKKARTKYSELRRFCRQKVGLEQFAKFPFEERTWEYDDYEQALAHAARINRKTRGSPTP